jgi:hypothetical protein
MRTLLVLFAIGTCCGSPVRAEPLDSKQVPADVKWLVHIDADAIKTGKVPQTIGALWLKVPSAAERLKLLCRTIGMDPAKELHGITIHGSRYTEVHSVVVVRAEVDRKRLMSFLRSRPGYETAAYRDHRLIAWTEKKGQEDEHTVTGCLYRPAVMVFGRDAAEVKKALDVLDGTSPGLEEGDPLFAPDPPAGTMTQALGADLANVQLPFKSPLVKKSKLFSVTLGERDGNAFAVARIVTESPEIAGQVRAVVEGLLAMAELQFDSDKEATEILEAVEVSTNGSTVTVRFEGPADQVSRLIEKAWKNRLKPK